MTAPAGTALDCLAPADLRSVLIAYRDVLRAHQERLNRLNVYPVPDGDTGTNMALTLESVVAELSKEPDAGDMASVCRAISHGSLMGARGNSGVILSQILRGLTGRLKTEDAVDGTVLAEALGAATTAAYEAVMRPVEGTILTVVRLAGEAALAATKDDGATLGGVVDAAAAAAREALERTPELLPVLAQAGVVDAGGAGFVLFLDALLHVIDGRPVSQPQAEPAAAGVAAAPTSPSTDAASDDLRYEVMFFLEAPDENVAGFKQAWAAVGDSIVVVGGDGLWNCHIHTNDIGAAVEAAVEAGRPRQIRVTDLAEQVAHEECLREDNHGEPQEPQAATAVVAVGSGEGVGVILRSLGVQAVVAGGQSMNPSTAELLQAVDAAAADAVVLLPNNKNVVPVAEQVVSLAAKPVKVVPTTSIAEGFAALIGFDGAADAETNAKSMEEASRRVRWGEVTWAVRDATTAAGAVKEGEHLALLGHDIVAVAADVSDAACALLDRLVEAEDELVTVVEGEAATREATESITGWLAQHRPEAAVEVHRGDQPLAAYLFSAE
ncbi:MAG: DAK2 domain-containing protein [Actinobacteria bacterium]|nr:DAK2 domain-containing protein [Actinomycetota bacterium]